MRIPPWLLLSTSLLAGCGTNPEGKPPTPARAVEPDLAALLDRWVAIHVARLSPDSLRPYGGILCLTGLKPGLAGPLILVGRPATVRLIRALRDRDRAVAAHLVLTAIWESEKWPHGVFFQPDNGRGKGECNGLRWAVVPDGLSFSEADLREVEGRWNGLIAESPVAEDEIRDAGNRAQRELARTALLLPRSRRDP